MLSVFRARCSQIAEGFLGGHITIVRRCHRHRREAPFTHTHTHIHTHTWSLGFDAVLRVCCRSIRSSLWTLSAVQSSDWAHTLVQWDIAHAQKSALRFLPFVFVVHSRTFPCQLSCSFLRCRDLMCHRSSFDVPRAHQASLERELAKHSESVSPKDHSATGQSKSNGISPKLQMLQTVSHFHFFRVVLGPTYKRCKGYD